MTVGFVMLVHEALGRAGQVAAHWADQGSPVVIHVDRRVPRPEADALRARLADRRNCLFSPATACEWGTFSIVRATQAAVAGMLAENPGVSHVFLASGACVPLRPVADLEAFLAARPGIDFIESVTTDEVRWAVGGLDRERFTLRFPFSWRRHRRLFDGHVALQRALGVSRRIPQGIEPHLGSQWWCLTRRTLEAILEDPRRREFDRYFRRVWIPDEAYFQTLVRRHALNVQSRSLTLSKFDFQGKPHVFYDDHLELLRQSDCFVARKAWPHAAGLYAALLAPPGPSRHPAAPNPGAVDRVFARALARRTEGRAGLYMQSRYPNRGWENGRSCAEYCVLHGFDAVFPGFEAWLDHCSGAAVHGRLFAMDRAHFAGGAETHAGNLGDNPRLRDYDPQAFLTNLLWNTRGTRQCFQFGPEDNQAITRFLAEDPNAQVAVITGASLIPLFQAGLDFARTRKIAARHQQIETAFLSCLRRSGKGRALRVWTLAEFLEDWMTHLDGTLAGTGLAAGMPPADAPEIACLDGFGAFLDRLRNEGMRPQLCGDVAAIHRLTDGGAPTPRPRLSVVR